jgi:hypothetical protein
VKQMRDANGLHQTCPFPQTPLLMSCRGIEELHAGHISSIPNSGEVLGSSSIDALIMVAKSCPCAARSGGYPGNEACMIIRYANGTSSTSATNFFLVLPTTLYIYNERTGENKHDCNQKSQHDPQNLL